MIYFLSLIDLSWFRDIKSGSGLKSGLGLVFNYLTFLDVGFQTKVFRNVDDGTIPVGLPSALNIGRQSFHTLYVRYIFFNLWHDITIAHVLDKFKWSS